MPLHTTVNHDGQSSGQKGIHAFWESHLPEKFGGNYNVNTGPATYLQDVKKEIWRIIESSHKLADTVLHKEKSLRNQYPAGRVYETDPAGVVIKNKYNQTKHSYEYSKKYHEMLNGMVENQMRLSIAATANIWYTAWINAGRPDLITLDPQALTKRNKKFYKKEYRLWKNGQLFGLKTSEEF